MNPLIGITGSRHRFPVRIPAANMLGVVSGDDYARAVEACGGIPVVLPYVSHDDTVSRLASRLDGLVLGGGEDPDPALYGQSPQHGLGTVNLERDELELRLVAELLTAGKPIFGICRGIQLLNVAFGGTLWQDLGHHWHGTIQHQQNAGRKHLSHILQIAPGSRLQSYLGGTHRMRCNSFHHQAVHHVGMELRPVAWDEEGLVEAIEHPDLPFVIGVQWHPENLWSVNAPARQLFQAFVDTARSASGPAQSARSMPSPTPRAEGNWTGNLDAGSDAGSDVGWNADSGAVDGGALAEPEP